MIKSDKEWLEVMDAKTDCVRRQLVSDVLWIIPFGRYLHYRVGDGKCQGVQHRF
jgi:hypothetical protein